MNKRFLFVIGALLAAAAGCDKEPCAACQEEEAEIRHVVFESESDGEDHRVGESLLYVFGPTGELIGCHAAVEGAFDFFLTDDVYDFEAVVNKADLPTAGVTRAQLLQTLTTLAENAPDHLVMCGALDAHRIETDEKITVEVQRIAMSPIWYHIPTVFGCDSRHFVTMSGSSSSGIPIRRAPMAIMAAGPPW